MTKTVVILLSDKRSGSTLLQRILCQHLDIQHVQHTPHTYYETHHWLKAAVMLQQDARLFSGGTVYKGYGSRRNARTYMEACLRDNLPDFALPADDRRLVFEGWDALCKRYAAPIFFEKSPQHLAHWAALALMLEWIQSSQLNVKVIGLTRHPLAVLHSAAELFGTPPDARQYGWLEIQRNLLSFSELLPSGAYLGIRYEDLITDSPTTLESIGSHIGVSALPSMAEEIHQDSLQSWKQDSNFFVQLADPTIQMAQHFGYREFDLAPNATPELQATSLRQQRRARILTKLRDRVIKPVLLKRKVR